MIVSVGEKLKVINSIVASETFGRMIEFGTVYKVKNMIKSSRNNDAMIYLENDIGISFSILEDTLDLMMTNGALIIMSLVKPESKSDYDKIRCMF